MRYSAAQSTGKQLLFILYHSRPLAFISGLASVTVQRSALRESRRLACAETGGNDPGCWMLDALTRPQVLPFLNLSGFAPLRETSAIQSREELFTPRRQGANEEAFQSKSTIPFLNLSGFASLREPGNCVERGLCRNAGEGAVGPSKSVLICGAARHFRFCLLSSYL